MRNIWQRIMTAVAPRQAPPRFPVCTHEKVRGSFTIRVKGVDVVRTSSERCPACVQACAEQCSTTCAVCTRPIVPGMLVGRSGRTDFPLVHDDTCVEDPNDFCGQWGEGRLIGLHEFNPHKYEPGTITLHDVARQQEHHEHRHHH